MTLSFLRGMVATVNPCGFILLPTYLMYFLGMQGSAPGSSRSSIRRALVVGSSLSAGFMAVFVAVGLVSYHFTNWLVVNAKYATVAIGIGLVVLGVAMLAGYKLPISTPTIDAGGRSTGVGSMFVFGVAYAVASLGCTIGLFLPSLFAARSDGFVAGVARVGAYGVGMALVVMALTVALAVANTSLLGFLRSGMRYVQTIAAVFVIASGLYLVYYFWVVDVNRSIDPITSAVERFQTSVLAWLTDNWQVTAVVLAAVVVAGVVAVVVRRADPAVEVATIDGADEAVDPVVTGSRDAGRPR